MERSWVEAKMKLINKDLNQQVVFQTGKPIAISEECSKRTISNA